MKTNYVLIDYENVHARSLEQLVAEHFKVLVFVGASQAHVGIELAQSLQPLGSRARYITISGNGRNALDFHIAYYIGRLAAEEPSAYFHIISKDTGFDPLIQHLRSKKIRANRYKTVAGIPVVKTPALILQQRQHSAGVPEEHAICFSEPSFPAV